MIADLPMYDWPGIRAAERFAPGAPEMPGL